MNTENGIGIRIKAFIEFLGMNMNSFSSSLGLPNNSAIVRIVNDPARGISLPLIQKMGTIYKDLDLNWLILGIGAMIKGKNALDPRLFHIKYYRDQNEKETDMMRISGYADCDSAFNVFGDGMAPKFRPGDVILCKSMNKDDNVLMGEAYLIIVQDRPILRYIKGVVEDHYKTGAESPRFDESTIAIADVKALFLVKGVIRREAF